MSDGSFQSVVQALASHTGRRDFFFHQELNVGLANWLYPDRTARALELLETSNIELLERRYLDNFEHRNEILLVKSPKNTGKTSSLKSLLIDPGKTVLYIGHRVSLLEQAAANFGLELYTKKKNAPRYAVTLDSLSRASRQRSYDFVVIDEAEQVLNHFFSDPMKARQNVSMLALQYHLRRAKQVIALDADLSWAALNFFGAFTNTEAGQKLRIVLNQFKIESPRQLFLHETQRSLEQGVLEAADLQQRVFLVSDDKGYIDRTYDRLIESTEISRTKILKVTSETTHYKNVREFLGSPASHSRKYQIVLASPSISAGLDISFANQETVFQRVFGVFFGHHFTPMECDQQLARVRDPGRLDVYVSPDQLVPLKNKWDESEERDFFDLNNLPQQVENAVVAAVRNVTLRGYSADGSEIREFDHPLEELAKDLLPPRYFSRRHLRSNFLQHMEQQGFSIEHVRSVPVGQEPPDITTTEMLSRVMMFSAGNVAQIDPGDVVSRKALLLKELFERAALLVGGEWRTEPYAKEDLKVFAEETNRRRGEIEAVLGFKVRSNVLEQPGTALNSILELVGVKKRTRKTNRKGDSTLLHQLEL